MKMKSSLLEETIDKNGPSDIDLPEIMVGGGLNKTNVKQFYDELGISCFHLSGRVVAKGNDGLEEKLRKAFCNKKQEDLFFQETQYVCSVDKLQEVINQIF